MDELTNVQPAADAGDFELGNMLGSRKAFAAVAGRCSAADAECLRRIRDQKMYLRRAATWDEFCPKFLGLSRTQANRVIQYLEEFGPDYFELAQLTRITPQQFRAIAPAVREKNIHVGSEAIALLPENGERVAAAVAELRRAASETPALSKDDRIAALERRFDKWTDDVEALLREELSKAEREEARGLMLRASLSMRVLGR